MNPGRFAIADENRSPLRRGDTDRGLTVRTNRLAASKPVRRTIAAPSI